MKKLALSLFLTTSLFASGPPPQKVDLQIQYTKALIDIVNAQSGASDLASKYAEAKKATEDAMAKANAAVQAVLQQKSAECAAKKEEIDGKALQEKGLLTCAPPAVAKAEGSK